MDFKVKFPGRKKGKLTHVHHKVPDSIPTNQSPPSIQGDSTSQQRRLSQDAQNGPDKSFDGLFDNQKYAFITANKDIGAKYSLFPNVKRQVERSSGSSPQNDALPIHETMSSEDAYKTIAGPSPQMLQNPFESDKSRNANVPMMGVSPPQSESIMSQRLTNSQNTQDHSSHRQTSSPRHSFGSSEFQVPNQKLIRQSIPSPLLSPIPSMTPPVPIAIPEEQPGLEIPSAADNTLPRDHRTSFASSIHSNGSVNSPQISSEPFQASHTSGFYPSPSPFQSTFQPLPNSLTTPVDYGSSYQAASRPAEPNISSSSTRRTIANPFTMRALSDSMRNVVLDQGLSATLEDGKIIEMSALDVAACRTIMESWTTIENSNGIPYKNAYLCLKESRLPLDHLAKIWEVCQKIARPIIPEQPEEFLAAEEFFVALYLIHNEIGYSMESLKSMLISSSSVNKKLRSKDSKIIHNGRIVICSPDAGDILRLLGVSQNRTIAQETLDKALHIAASKGFRTATETFISHGANIDSACQGIHRTALQKACGNGHHDVVSILLQHGSDTNARDEDGRTALHFAAQDGNLDTVRLLIDAGANIFAEDDEGDTVLHYASEYGHTSIVKLLVTKGVNINTRGPKGRTPLMRAACGGHKSTIRYLLDHGADILSHDDDGGSPLHCAVRFGNENIAQTLAEEGVSVSERSGNGQTALCLAVHHSFRSLVRLLIELGAPVNDEGYNGMVPLHLAAANGNDKIVKVLLNSGAILDALTKDGLSPLILAANFGHLAVVEILLDAGADPEAEDKKNFSTALHFACAKGHEAIVKALLMRGALVTEMNGDGKLPMDLAKDFPKITSMLKAHGHSGKKGRKWTM